MSDDSVLPGNATTISLPTTGFYGQDYKISTVLISVCLSFIGTISIFKLMNTIKYSSELKNMIILIVFMSMGIPLVSIWNLSFLSVYSMRLTGTEILVNIVYTIISLVGSILLNIIGFGISFVPFLYHHLETYKNGKVKSLFIDYVNLQSLKKKDYYLMALGGIFLTASLILIHFLLIFSLEFKGDLEIDWKANGLLLISGFIASLVLFLNFFSSSNRDKLIPISFLFCGLVTSLQFISFKYIKFIKNPSNNLNESYTNYIHIKDAGEIVIISSAVLIFIINELSSYFEVISELCFFNFESFVKKNDSYSSLVNKFIIKSLDEDQKLKNALLMINDLDRKLLSEKSKRKFDIFSKEGIMSYVEVQVDSNENEKESCKIEDNKSANNLQSSPRKMFPNNKSMKEIRKVKCIDESSMKSSKGASPRSHIQPKNIGIGINNSPTIYRKALQMQKKKNVQSQKYLSPFVLNNSQSPYSVRDNIAKYKGYLQYPIKLRDSENGATDIEDKQSKQSMDKSESFKFGLAGENFYFDCVSKKNLMSIDENNSIRENNSSINMRDLQNYDENSTDHNLLFNMKNFTLKDFKFDNN